MLTFNEKWQHFEHPIRPHRTITFFIVAILGISLEWDARAGTCKNAPVILAHFNLSGPSCVSKVGGYNASSAVDYTPDFLRLLVRSHWNDSGPMIHQGTTVTNFSGILTALQIDRE
jgi:hypothetical protein